MDSEPEYRDCELDSPDPMGSEAIPDNNKSIEDNTTTPKVNRLIQPTHIPCCTH